MSSDETETDAVALRRIAGQLVECEAALMFTEELLHDANDRLDELHARGLWHWLKFKRGPR